LAEEIEREVFVPTARNFLVHLEGFISFGEDREVVVAVVDEFIINRRGSRKGLAIAHDDGPRWVGVDDVTAFDAPRREGGARHDAKDPSISAHGLRPPGEKCSSQSPGMERSLSIALSDGAVKSGIPNRLDLDYPKSLQY